MYDCDIVYIKGNPNSGSSKQHNHINNIIKDMISKYSYKIISSNRSNKEFCLPKAKVYIGFSRGSRYLKKLSTKCLKISIGGVCGSGIYSYINKKDKVQDGDMSEDSLSGHFEILKKDQSSILLSIDNFLV
jgi:hypothetical protein